MQFWVPVSVSYPSVCLVWYVYFSDTMIFPGLFSLIGEQHRTVFLLSQHVIFRIVEPI